MSLLFQISYQHDHAVRLLADQIRTRIKQHPTFQTTVIFCIGTDRCTGDSLGPLVGMFLQKAQPSHLIVKGTLQHPIHALNLKQSIAELSTLVQPLVISIDACLGSPHHVGDIQVVNGPLRPGLGVKKVLPAIGDFHIKGIVNASGFLDAMVLQNTRLSTVMEMAEIIARAILQAYE